MRKFFYAITAVCCLFLLASNAWAADPVVAAVQKRYASVQRLQTVFTQVLEHKESGSKEEREGVLYISNPGLVRWETTSPVPELLLLTPEAVWNVFPDEDMAYKYPPGLSEEAGSVMRIMTGRGNLEKDFAIENKGTKDGLCSLMLYPANPTASMIEAELTVAVKNGEIRQVVIIDFYNNRNAISFTSQMLDPSLDAGLFVYTPGKNVKVEDRTQGEVFVSPLTQ